MDRKGLKNSFFDGEEAEEMEIRRRHPPGFVPWSNSNELKATERNTTKGPGTSNSRHVASSARHQDTRSGAEGLSRPGRHPPEFIEETRPGVVRVPGIGNVEGYDEEEATVTASEEPTGIIIARVVDTEEENRRLRAHEQLRIEHDQLLHERDKLHRIPGNEVIVDPVAVPNRDVEDGSKVAANDRDLPENNECKCGTRCWRLLAVGAILLTVVAIVATLVIVFRPDPTELECTLMTDGTCRMEDFPIEGFHVDFLCPASASSVSDCSSCDIVNDDNGDQCNSCTVCSETVAYDCSNIAENDCVIMDCAGNCEGSPPTPTPTTPMPTDPTPTDPPENTMECSLVEDGTASTCHMEGEGWKVDFRCPADVETSYDCSTCTLSMYDNQCTSCTVCDATYTGGQAFDCSNLFPEDECAIKDCDGKCKN